MQTDKYAGAWEPHDHNISSNGFAALCNEDRTKIWTIFI